MEKVVEEQPKLTYPQRNLLSVAFKNVVGARRSAWRIISSSIEGEKDAEKVEVKTEYKHKVRKELEDICRRALVSAIIICSIVVTNTALLSSITRICWTS